MRADVSAEGLNTLSAESRRLIRAIPADRPVFIQAYVSPDVPREYVETKADLLNLLREIDAVGGDRIQLNLVETELYSEEAREAESKFGITPRRVFTNEDARYSPTGDLPGRCVHLGARGGRRPVLRPRRAGRVRTGPVDPRGLRRRAQEGRHPDDRRPHARRVRLPVDEPANRVADRHRAEEAVRGQLGQRRRVDPDRSRRVDRRPAVVPDAAADRQPDGLCSPGRPGAPVRRPDALRRPDPRPQRAPAVLPAA